MAADCGAVRTSLITLHSIWPADRELPLGWHDAGKEGLKPEVLAWIEEVWTDMRPKSLRDRMSNEAPE
jgi:MbtH protein